MKGPVTQAWVHDLSFMQQTVLLTAIRGPDGIPKRHKAKMLVRWYRRCVLVSALDGKVLRTPYEFGGGSFTGPSYEPTVRAHDWREPMAQVVNDYIASADDLPHHYQMHLMHAAQIVGAKHSDEPIRLWWREIYERVVNAMHLHAETDQELDERLGDTEEGWRKRVDPSEITCSD